MEGVATINTKKLEGGGLLVVRTAPQRPSSVVRSFRSDVTAYCSAECGSDMRYFEGVLALHVVGAAQN